MQDASKTFDSIVKMQGGRSRRSTRKVGGRANIPQEGGMSAVGTRAQVMHGTAHHTSGGLTKKDLKYNRHGRIVSRRASAAGKRALRRLERAGFKARKGSFKLFTRKSRRRN